MSTQQRLALATLLALGGAAAFSGCGLVVVCTDELRFSVVVEVRDAATGGPAAHGVTGISEHESGVVTEFIAGGDLRLYGNWNSELPGNHTMTIRKPGYLTEVVQADVDADRCHVETETVEVEIAPDPRAVPEYPVSFVEGPDTGGWRPPSAEVEVQGDTLEIKGFAGTTGCTELRVAAFRSGNGLHVQVEPSDTPLDDCVARRFEARFLLPSGPTDLLVTNALHFPAVLFEGQVRPALPYGDRLSANTRNARFPLSESDGFTMYETLTGGANESVIGSSALPVIPRFTSANPSVA